ncbi:MAG: GSCFA domain-containing protein [Pseudomonadota bacterium]
MARSDMHPVHRFDPWQVWPGSYDNPFFPDQYPFNPESGLTLDRTTPLASMGSCFAREIRRRLIQYGYNYIQEEAEHPASIHASAAWERTYNTFSMRQIFEYTFESFEPRVRWWISPETGTVQDPFRRIIKYPDVAAAEADFRNHRECSRRALTRARILILTLGLTEIWRDRKDGSVICLPSGPYVNEGGNMDRYEFVVSRYAENLENLEAIFRIMDKYNPECRLLVTVSPVNLWATFRRDSDVVSASCNSKSTLRAVADEFVSRHDNATYFPAYEIATTFTMMRGQSCFLEERENFHINKPTVKFIMKQFFNRYSTEPFPMGDGR